MKMRSLLNWPRVVVACAAAVFTFVARAYGPGDYIQDGLTGMWDGICNSTDGAGNPIHDSAATEWVDLTGNSQPFALVAGNASFGPNALVCAPRASGYAAKIKDAKANDFATKYMTIQIALCGKTDAKPTMMVYHANSWGRHHGIWLDANAKIGFNQAGSQPYIATDWRNVGLDATFVYDLANTTIASTHYLNGAPDGTTGTLGASWTDSVGYPTIGAQNTAGANPFVGDLYALRYYSRRLTAAEVAFNSHLDQARFNYAGNVHVLGFPEENGTPSPAYGGSTFEVGSTQTFTCGPTVTYGDGVVAADLGPGARAKCLGYRLGDGSSARVAASAVTLPVTDGLTIAWDWEVQYLVTVNASPSAPQVSIADGAAGATVSKWVTRGEKVLVKATPTSGHVCGWLNLPTGSELDVAHDSVMVAVSAPCTVSPIVANGSVRYWRGTTSSDSDVASNWLDLNGAEGCPETGDTIVLDEGSVPLTWTLAGVSPQHWIQSGYSGKVSFCVGTSRAEGGTPAEDGDNRELKLTGNAVISSGIWASASNVSFKKGSEEVTSDEGRYRLWVTVDGDLSVASDAAIDVKDCGFACTLGSGYHTSGGAHGGTGASSGYLTLGSLFEPVLVGTGGNNDFAGYGAGAVKLTVGGVLALDGTINATPSAYKKGTTYLCSHYPAPGGSIWLTAKQMTGRGSVLANSGDATETGRGGGGGRIALYLTGEGETFDELGWTVECFGKASGTVYRETASDFHHRGELIVRALGAADVSRGTATNWVNSTPLKPLGDETSFRFRKIVLEGGVVLSVLKGATLDLTDTEISANTLKKDALAVDGGTLQLPGVAYAFDAAKPQLWVSGPHSTIEFLGTGAKTLTLANQARFDYPIALGCSLTLANGAKLFHTAQSVNGVMNYAVDLNVAGDLTVEAGASINVDKAGFANGGPGGSVVALGGGSYGGRGYGAGPDSKTYGDFRDPDWCGSGTGTGGGLVRLDVSGRVSLAGPITAIGGYDSNSSASGGGISIRCGTIFSTTAGKIQANAAPRNDWSKAAGGGGRVAISVRDPGADFSQLAGSVEAFGGGNSSPTRKLGGAGTVYYRLPGEGLSDGTLVIDQNNYNYTDDGADGPTTEFGAAYDGITVRQVVLKNKAHFRVRKGVTFNVTECWTNDNSGVVDCELGDAETNPGCVAFVDASKVGWIWGDSMFAMFQCVEPGKTLRFGDAASGSVLRISDGGILDLQGSVSEGGVTTPVVLRGISDSAMWPIAVGYGAITTLKNLDVSHSDANDSIVKPVAYDTPDDHTCVNWGFVNVVVGERITWLGNSSTDWSNGDNWDLGRRPEETDVVVIPADVKYSPVLSSSITLGELELASGATLSLNGCALTVTKSAKLYGHLVASGAEKLAFSGDVDFTGGTFTAARSTVTVSGSGDRAFGAGGCTFYRFVLAKTGGTLAMSGSLTAVEVVAKDLAAAFAVSFASGASWTVERLLLDGAIEDAPGLALGGGAWTLAVTQLQQVKGVMAENSTATRKKIWAQPPYADNGGNVNWGFETTGAKRWTGGVNSYFSEGGNWEGGVAPAAADYVSFTGASPIVITNDTVVREAVFASGTTVLRGENGATFSVENSLAVEGGAIARIDLPVRATNAVVRAGGLVQHTPCTTPSATHYGIDLAVSDKLFVEEGGMIDAVSRGYMKASGPGYYSCGATHGGWYSYESAQYGECLCYGSLFMPTLPGSGGNDSHSGQSSDATVTAHGGGVIRLTVGGTLEIDGAVSADGWTNQNYYAASGGSVLIRTGRLAGRGLVSADGGRFISDSAGGGGRVAVYRTAEDEGDASAFSGEIRAWGGRSTAQGSVPAGGCGTVYLAWRDTPEGAGQLVLDNGSSTGSTPISERGTELGVSEARDGDPLKSLSRLRVVVRNRAMLRMAADVTVADLVVQSANTRICLRDHTLSMRSRRHCRGKGWPIASPASYLSGNVSRGTQGTGALIWLPAPTMLIVR